MTEREQVAYLWKVLDQLHTAAQDVKQGHYGADWLPDYVLRKVTEATQTVKYPGEPPEVVEEHKHDP